MAKNTSRRVWASRWLLVLLALSLVPSLVTTTQHSAGCHDPLQTWSVQDQSTQAIEAQQLNQALPRTHATYGMALTIDADTGQLLTYYRTAPPRHCQDSWEPGSITKPLTVSAALDSGSITPNFTFYDAGYTVADRQYIYNWKPFPVGTKNLATLLGDSLNVGAVAVQRQFKTPALWHDYLHDHFMLDQSGPSDLAATEHRYGDYRYAVSAFGVGIVTTPLQMSLAYASLINGGTYHPACYSSTCATEGQRVLKPATSATIKQLLTTIYKQSGPPTPAGYTIGGKSGTAPLAQPSGDYITDQDSGTYVGYISHGGKTYIQLVRLDQPQGYSAASHAAREVWQAIVDQRVAQP